MTTQVRPIPGPRGNPLIGMAGGLRRDLLSTLKENFERYGDVVSYPLGPPKGPAWLRRETVAIHHPEGIHRVLTEDETFSRDTTSFSVLEELFGQNLVTTNGAVWRRQKRTLQPLFTPRHVQNFRRLIEREAEKVVAAQSDRPDGVMNVARTMEEYALRVLGHTLFQDKRGIDDQTVAALERLVPVVGRLVRSRATRIVRLPLNWPTPANRKFLATRAELYEVIEGVLRARASGQGCDSPDDLIGRLRDAQDPGNGEPVPEGEIRDQALIFLISGHTTTSNALTSTLYLLATNPEEQERVAEAALDEPRTEGDLVYAAVQEGMRLYPPSYVVGRRASTDVELNGYLIRAGSNVLVSPWITHRHPEFWPEPEKFAPGRFLHGDPSPRFAYIPFGGGGRSCIGRHFAMLESSIMVRALLRRYRLVALDEEVEMAELISLRPAGAVRVRCEPRPASSSRNLESAEIRSGAVR